MVMVLTVVFWGCRPGAPPAPEPVLRPVRTQQVVAGGGSRIRSFSGVARSRLESKISFRVSGTVSNLAVQIGDSVQQGELIAELDPVDYQLKVQEAEAAVRQAEAQLINAEANFERVRGLYENDNATRADYDSARTAVDSAQAAVEAGEKRLAQARQQLAYTELRAPLAGAVAEINVEGNENISQGQPIVMLTSGVRPEVEVAIPEQLIGQVGRGDPVSVRFDSIAGESFNAEVTEVGVASSRFSTTFSVKARLLRPESRVRPGMTAEVSFRFGGPRTGERFWVPPHTVSEDRLGRFVYVVIPKDEGLGVVERRPVEVGELSSDGLEILEGLKEGDRLVTAGIDQISDGMKVRILPQVSRTGSTAMGKSSAPQEKSGRALLGT